MIKTLILSGLLGCLAELTRGKEPADLSANLQGILGESEVPSLAAAAVLDGMIVSRGAAGVRKTGERERVTVADQYHIGSCTKSMTAVLAAILVEKGQLKWETTLSDVFSGLKIHPDYRAVTLRQLLSNSGGVPGTIEAALWKNLWTAKGSPVEQRMLLVKGILRERPAYPPGTKQLYSNAGFSVAGAMIEKRKDEAYESLLTRLVFEPLGMTSAGFRAPATNGKVDQPYGHSRRGDRLVAQAPEPRGDNPRAIAPAGGVHCSVLDLARYARFHLGQGGGDLIPGPSLDFLHTPEEGRDYALGWSVVERPWAGGRALTHTGTNTMFFSVVWIAPHKNFAAVAMCNCGGDEGFKKCDEAIALLVRKHLSDD